MQGITRYGLVNSDIMQDPELSVTAKAVYALLCTFADKDRKCFPSIRHLSELMGVSRRTVERSITELKNKTYVSKEDKVFSIQ